MEQKLETQAVVAEGKPITVKIAESGGALESIQVSYGATLEQALRKSTKFPKLLAAIDAGKEVQIRVKQKVVPLTHVLEDGDNVIIAAQVKGGV